MLLQFWPLLDIWVARLCVTNHTLMPDAPSCGILCFPILLVPEPRTAFTYLSADVQVLILVWFSIPGEGGGFIAMLQRG